MESEDSESETLESRVDCEAGVSGCLASSLLEEGHWESQAGGRIRSFESVCREEESLQIVILISGTQLILIPPTSLFFLSFWIWSEHVLNMALACSSFLGLLHSCHLFEESFLRRMRSMRTDPGSNSRISLAFSGGGVRAAFVATGVLWRLAECGRLKDVDYISGVSGGTYAATAFASHVVAEEPPSGNVDHWYLQVVAKLIARMQNNTPYLCRDLWQDVPAESQIGSGVCPRICDIFQLLVVALGTVLRAPVAVTVLLILPLVEVIECLNITELVVFVFAFVFQWHTRPLQHLYEFLPWP